VVYRLGNDPPAFTSKAKRQAAEISKTTLTELITNGLFDEATKELKVLSHFKSVVVEEYCYPAKVGSTWKGANLVQELRKLCDDLHKSIESSGLDRQAGRIVGIRPGTGCGKSHILLEAPKILNNTGIYITYNLDQNLQFDKEHPQESVLLRIILRLRGVPNTRSPTFFKSGLGRSLLSLGADALRPFVIDQLNRVESDIFIGVDEIMDLRDVAVIRAILSELGELSYQLFLQKSQKCNVFATSLQEEPFHTISGRTILPWTPEVPDETAAELILQTCSNNRDMKGCTALAISAAGFHFRSLVFAARAISDVMNPTVQSILGQVYARWKKGVSGMLLSSIRLYVMDSCRGTTFAAQPPQLRDTLEPFVDVKYALPPPLICGAFGVIHETSGKVDVENPLYGMFNCDYAYKDPAKHLEQFGLHYDLFRHKHELPVVPLGISVAIPSGQSSSKTSEWFRRLGFPSILEKCSDSLISHCGNSKENSLTEHGKAPLREKYYAPKQVNHPLIDRAFIAKHNDTGDECFVLIHDKLNGDMAKAVKDLNSAARLIKAWHLNMEVLCIVNLIGATSRSRNHKHLEFPYVLVRDDELDSFYSVNFAPVARFARSRHDLSAD